MLLPVNLSAQLFLNELAMKTQGAIRVSVIIPCYNEERELSTCLTSLQQQTVAPYEIIVVDNNSTDSTAAIAKSFGAKVVVEPRQGISYARDAGFDAATGDVIARIDADSVADSHWVENIQQHMAADNDLVALGGDSYWYELRKAKPLTIALQRQLTKLHENRLNRMTVLYGYNQAVRRNTWHTVHHSSAAPNEDIHFSLDMRSAGKVRRFDDVVVGNRIGGFLRPKKLWKYWREDGKVASQMRHDNNYSKR